ncbi:glycosyltransferase [Gramella sp. MAR_2010_147]|uniref:glycosyltransferase n=1 Tax=Gramella sp. MAR_2010_147 TaxID=1250205 RepID=UPI00087BC167|nr:glycosyltransferase [Gramella sp. MAR_2010_147]SDS00914.1 Glycosyltransferase involved in cell wall bisynthesis [Gramella sp. MAR_2010_147]
MHFSVFTHAEHFEGENTYFSYSPYIREMNIWFDFIDEVTIIAPLKNKKTAIDSSYNKNVEFAPIKTINFTSFKNSVISFFRIPVIVLEIYRAMYKTDHIHIRCPGNIGLLAALVQILFPGKSKTIKYAGNWDPKSEQPWTYRFQKWILKNEFLTRNANVLVYGEWSSRTNNIIPFFTASYSESNRNTYIKDFSLPQKFIFVGTLSEGKRPLLAVQIIHKLLQDGSKVFLDIYGSGIMEEGIRKYVEDHGLESNIILHGNQNAQVIMNAYKNSHFSILPSKSEGWPKALAESMFFGCIPVATSVSCVPWMLGYGNRGFIIEPEVGLAAQRIKSILSDEMKLNILSIKAQQWSQVYTLEKFRIEIKKLL